MSEASSLLQPDSAAIIVRRPHFRLVGDEIFFLISRRPLAQLSTAECAVWNSIDGLSTLGELRTRCSGDADRAIRRLVDLDLCEIVRASYPSGRQRVIVFEPHSDDAVLSVGGTMWLRRDKCEFVVVTIGSKSNFTSYYDLERDFFDVDRISAIRNAEGALFARLLGGQHHALNLPEAALRYQNGSWSLDWYRQHKVSISAFIDHRSGASELCQWTEAIRSVLEECESDEVWFPLGSPHTDHQLTRDASITLLRESPDLFEGRQVRYYQDVPYAARFPTFTGAVVDALTMEGSVLKPESVSIDSVFSDKLRLVSLYGSQFKLDAIRADVESSARPASGPAGLCERFWLVQRLPGAIDLSRISAHEFSIRHATEQLARWTSRFDSVEQIRLLLLFPAGRWAEDMEYLVRFFPAARFDAYVAPAGMGEVSRFESPRVRVHLVGSGTRAWLGLALRLMWMRPATILFVTGERRAKAAQYLRMLWPLSRTAVVPSMNVLVSALRRLVSDRPRSDSARSGYNGNASFRTIR